MNKSKKRGTAFESAFCKWWKRRTGDDRVRRSVLAGRNDVGDIHGIFAHGAEGIVECKDHKTWSRANLDEWKAETEVECANAGADFALLVVHKANCDATGLAPSFARNHCFIRLCDLPTVHLGLAGRMWPHGSPVEEINGSVWARFDLGEVADMMMAEQDEVV